MSKSFESHGVKFFYNSDFSRDVEIVIEDTQEVLGIPCMAVIHFVDHIAAEVKEPALVKEIRAKLQKGFGIDRNAAAEIMRLNGIIENYTSKTCEACAVQSKIRIQMKRENTQLLSRVRSLTQENEKLKGRSNFDNAGIESLEEDLKTAHEDIDTFKEEAERLQENYDALARELADVKKELEQEKKVFQQAKKSIIRYENVIDMMHNKIFTVMTPS